MKVRCRKSIIIFVWTLFSISATSQESDSLTEYVGPEAIEYVQANYPLSVARRGGEGWVVINYMVDTNGKAFEPSVVASAGSELFESVALEALGKSTFKPAHLDGKAVEGSNAIRYNFALPKEKAAMRLKFYKRYEKIRDNFDSLDQKEFAKRLKRLEDSVSLNHYERAYLDYSRYQFARRFGTESEQMHHIENALQHEYLTDDKKTYLPDSIVFPLRRNLFKMQVNQQYYAEALKTLKNIADSDNDKKVFKELEPYYRRLAEMQNSEVPYTITDETNVNGSWSILLFKSRISVEGNSQGLAEVKLRCESKYLFFEFSEGFEYEIPEESGQCYLQLLGNANQAFTLTQF